MALLIYFLLSAQFLHNLAKIQEQQPPPAATNHTDIKPHEMKSKKRRDGLSKNTSETAIRSTAVYRINFQSGNNTASPSTTTALPITTTTTITSPSIPASSTTVAKVVTTTASEHIPLHLFYTKYLGAASLPPQMQINAKADCKFEREIGKDVPFPRFDIPICNDEKNDGPPQKHVNNIDTSVSTAKEREDKLNNIFNMIAENSDALIVPSTLLPPGEDRKDKDNDDLLDYTKLFSTLFRQEDNKLAPKKYRSNIRGRQLTWNRPKEQSLFAAKNRQNDDLTTKTNSFILDSLPSPTHQRGRKMRRYIAPRNIDDYESASLSAHPEENYYARKKCLNGHSNQIDLFSSSSENLARSISPDVAPQTRLPFKRYLNKAPSFELPAAVSCCNKNLDYNVRHVSCDHQQRQPLSNRRMGLWSTLLEKEIDAFVDTLFDQSPPQSRNPSYPRSITFLKNSNPINDAIGYDVTPISSFDNDARLRNGNKFFAIQHPASDDRFYDAYSSPINLEYTSYPFQSFNRLMMQK